MACFGLHFRDSLAFRSTVAVGKSDLDFPRAVRTPHVTKKSPVRRYGRGFWRRTASGAVLLARAGPDEAVAFTILVLEHVGEDRRVEARIKPYAQIGKAQ